MAQNIAKQSDLIQIKEDMRKVKKQLKIIQKDTSFCVSILSKDHIKLVKRVDKLETDIRLISY